MVALYLKQADELLMHLLSITGLSGEEGRVMDFLVGQLRAAGATDEVLGFDQANRKIPHGGETGNLVLKLPGTRPGMRRMLMAHTDTVPICRVQAGEEGPVHRSGRQKHGPWGGRPQRHGRHPRRGFACSPRKAGTWSAHFSLDRARGGRPVRRPLCNLAMLGRPKLAFNFDGGPTDKITIGATGGYRIEIRISGLASHAGAAPEHGVSAINIAALAIADLYGEGWLGKIKKPAGSGTSNVGVIHGGEATNVITPEVLVRAEARSHDRAFREKIIKTIEKAFTAARER